MIVNFLAFPRYFNMFSTPVVLLAVAGLWSLLRSRPAVLRWATAILIVATVPFVYRACSGTALTRTDPIRQVAALIGDREGQVWTDDVSWHRLDFHTQFRGRLRHVNGNGRPGGGPVWAVLDDVELEGLAAVPGSPVAPEWRDPPAGWRKVASFPLYRPYPGVLGRLVAAIRLRERESAIVVYEVPPIAAR